MQPSRRGAPPTPVTEFRRHLRVLEREIVRQLEGETTCCGVTLPQCHVLLELSFADLSLTALARALALDKSTLSRTVDGLVQARLVERKADAADRRALRLRLAAAGRERVRTINTLCNRYYEALLGRLSGNEQRQVLTAVRLLAEGMRRARSESSADVSCCQPTRSPARRPLGPRRPKRRAPERTTEA